MGEIKGVRPLCLVLGGNEIKGVRSKGSGLFVWSLGEMNPRAAAGADG
jgi:hypothetical protein